MTFALPLLLANCALQKGASSQSSIAPGDTEFQQGLVPKNYVISSSDPESLASLAQLHHPQLVALRLRAERLDAQAVQVGALPDPNASFATGGLPETAAGRVQGVAGISQKIPLKGKRGAAASAVRHEAEAVRSEAAALTLRIREQVKSAWWDYFLATKTISYTSEIRSFSKRHVMW